ncbi:hypothetical protein RP20_CCG017825 [Aedes albopictus]|nr:hypothetical protein RP20_CCG017825 [Aedes albopictus]
MNDDANHHQQSEQARPGTNAKIRCPPIFVYNWSVTQINNLMSSPAVSVKSFTQKVIKSGIRLQVKEKVDFDKAIGALKLRNAKFYTHGTSDEMPIKIVLTGLPVFDLGELKSELHDNGISPSEVKLVRSTSDGDLAWYLLLFPKGAIKLRDLQKTHALFNVTVTWRYYSKKQVDAVQCFRCQQFGHGMRHCNMEPKCVKCGELHLSNECPLPSLIGDDRQASRLEIRCANCSQNHTANFKGCPSRKNFIQMSEEKKMRRRTATSTGASKPFGATYTSRNRRFADVVKENPATDAAVGGAAAAVGAVKRVAAVVDLAGSASGNQSCANNSSDLFSLSEFLSLANDLFTRLATCKTKASQFLALSELMFKYVFNG